MLNMFNRETFKQMPSAPDVSLWTTCLLVDNPIISNLADTVVENVND